MAVRYSQDRRPGEFATGIKTAVVVVVLGLIAALADHSLVSTAEPAAAARAAPDTVSEPYAGAERIAVPFTVTAGDVEPSASSF